MRYYTWPTIKEWAAALRSGNYQQAEGALNEQGERFCCLGVYCDLIAPDSWERWEPGDVAWSWSNPFLVDADEPHPRAMPPTSVQKAIEKQLPEGLTCAALAEEYNDAGASFGDIADMIEGKLSPEDLAAQIGTARG